MTNEIPILAGGDAGAPSYLTPAQLAETLGVGHTTVEEWLKNREIEFFKKGRLVRIPREAFVEFVRRYTLRARGSG